MIYVAFLPEATIGWWGAIWWCVFLGGAMPFGIVSMSIVNFTSRRIMRSKSKGYDSVIRFLKAAPAEKITQATEALRDKLRLQRAKQEE